MIAVLIADSTRSEVPNIMAASTAAACATIIAVMLAAHEHARIIHALDIFHFFFLPANPSAAPSGAR